MKQSVTHILEDIMHESTEDIDIDKEREEWAQCVMKTEIKHDLIKEVSYTRYKQNDCKKRCWSKSC